MGEGCVEKKHQWRAGDPAQRIKLGVEGREVLEIPCPLSPFGTSPPWRVWVAHFLGPGH